jgi:outer membrane lipase/esterase
VQFSRRSDALLEVGRGAKTSLWGFIIAFALVGPVSAAFARYSNLYVFGDSLSDSGNNAVVLQPNVTPVPIPGNAFIPTFPYASGHYTNAEVWAQILASSLGLSANPSLLRGTDYAFGGARTGPLTANSFPGGVLNPFPPSLETQVAFFLSQHGFMAPRDAIYIVEGGGDNARDALSAIGGCSGNLACITSLIQSTAADFAADIDNIDSALETAGAQSIIVWNAPDIGKTPAVTAAGASMLGTAIASAMNDALLQATATDPHIKLFDAFGLLDDAIADPAAFGLSNVTDACAQFTACDPSQFLFWDGIHPTSAAETFISDAILSLVYPNPRHWHSLGSRLRGSAVYSFPDKTPEQLSSATIFVRLSALDRVSMRHAWQRSRVQEKFLPRFAWRLQAITSTLLQ